MPALCSVHPARKGLPKLHRTAGCRSGAADVVTMGGALNDRDHPHTVDKAGRIIKNKVSAVETLAK